MHYSVLTGFIKKPIFSTEPWKGAIFWLCRWLETNAPYVCPLEWLRGCWARRGHNPPLPPRRQRVQGHGHARIVWLLQRLPYGLLRSPCLFPSEEIRQPWLKVMADSGLEKGRRRKTEDPGRPLPSPINPSIPPQYIQLEVWELKKKPECKMSSQSQMDPAESLIKATCSCTMTRFHSAALTSNVMI